MNQSISLTAVVPFYNEAGRIAEVLRLLRQSRYIADIIAVDDGSSDGSLTEAQAVDGIEILHQSNAGKSAAVRLGLSKVTSEYVLLFDADSGEMTVRELDSGLQLLGMPIAQVTGQKVSGNVSMVLFFKRQFRLLSPDGTDFLTGQRALPTVDIQTVFETYQSTGFGLETDINDYMFIQKRGVVWVQTEVKHQSKVEKYGLFKGLVGSVKMLNDERQAGTLQKFGQWKQAWLPAVLP